MMIFNSLFPPVTDREHIASQNYAMMEYKIDLVRDFLDKTQTIREFFVERGATRIAIYGCSEFAKMSMLEIDCDQMISVVGVFDKQYTKIQSCMGMKVESMDEMIKLYENGVIDKILICTIFHRYEIIEQLIKNGIKYSDIFTIQDVIYSW